mgnify:CR=1 FL=1
MQLVPVHNESQASILLDSMHKPNNSNTFIGNKYEENNLDIIPFIKFHHGCE